MYTKKGLGFLKNPDGTPVKPSKERLEAPLMEKADDRTHYCTSCGKGHGKLKGNFRPSQSPFFQGLGYIPICNKCLDYYEKEYTIRLGCNDEAIRRLALHLDLYLDESLLAASRRVNISSSRIAGYISKANLMQYKGKTYDTYLDERVGHYNMKVVSADELEKHEQVVSQKAVEFWGAGFMPDDYAFLGSKYDDWTSRHECKTKVQESVFQKICLMELQILKAAQKGDKMDGLIKSFNDLLGTANIKPVQNRDNALADQNTFGTLIQKWENEEPIPEPDPEWEDVDGIRKYVSTWFLGHLCKMLGIRNSYSQMYDEEIGKYTVEKPEYEEDMEMSFDDLFGNVGEDDEDGEPNG